MLPSSLFDQQSTYTLQELADFFGCDEATVKDWRDEGKLVDFTTSTGHEYLGYDVIRAVENSDELYERLLEAQEVKDRGPKSQYTKNLEERIKELETENRRLREIIRRDQSHSMEDLSRMMKELLSKVDRLTRKDARV